MMAFTATQLLLLTFAAAAFGGLLTGAALMLLLLVGKSELDDERAGISPVHLGEFPERRRNPDADRFRGPTAVSLMRWQRHD